MTADEVCKLLIDKIYRGKTVFKVNNIRYRAKYSSNSMQLKTDYGYRLISYDNGVNWSIYFKDALIMYNIGLADAIIYVSHKPWTVELYSSLRNKKISFTEIINNRTIFNGGSRSNVENTLNLIGTILYICATSEEIHYIAAYDNNNEGSGLADIMYCGKTIECKRLKSKEMLLDKLEKSVEKADIFMGFMDLDTFNKCGSDIFSGIKRYNYEDIAIISVQPHFESKKLSLVGEIESLNHSCRLSYFCNIVLTPVHKKNTPLTMNNTVDNEPGEYVGDQVTLDIAIGHKLISVTLEERVQMSDGVAVINIGKKIIHGFGGVGCIILSTAKALRLGFNCSTIYGMNSINVDGRTAYTINIDDKRSESK